MKSTSRIDILKDLITKVDALQKLGDGFGMLFRRLNALLKKIQSAKKQPTLSTEFDSLLESIGTFLEQEQKELQISEFNQFNLRLLDYLISLTNDSKKKIELFTAVLRDDRVVRKEQYANELRQRESLRKVLIHAALKDLSQESKKILETLNSQFKPIVKPYIDKCISVHGTIQVRGLEQITQNFGARFYGQKPVKTVNSKAPLVVTVDIPLQSEHVCFRADKSTAFEREQAREAMVVGSKPTDEYDEVLWTKLAAAPYMPSLVERDRFVSKEDENQSLSPGSVLQKNRWMVILGNPGSEKTTLVRWLALKFAQILKREEHLVKLFNFTGEVAKSETINVGPSRIPILIRVGEYGDALRVNNTLSHFDYIGRHQWIGQTFINIASETEPGQALIILDGLDEIPASEQRHCIVERIEHFVNQFVQTPSCVSAFDQEKFGFSWNQLSEMDLPMNAGGNQIIVTSIDLFIDHWFNAVHRQLLRILRIPSQTEEMIKSKINKQTSLLKKEIQNPNYKGLRELASNPLLLSVICMMSFQSHDQVTNALPVHRVCLYQDAVQ
ncbi:hypothetical protein I4U23_021914 [Adineta vaga]|nr:hypothetical protein I4U23_021914 [Adineta vaga]